MRDFLSAKRLLLTGTLLVVPLVSGVTRNVPMDSTFDEPEEDDSDGNDDQ